MTQAEQVQHVPERSRFELACTGGPAVLTYVRTGDRVVLDHTLVPAACEGQGLGSALARAALTWASQEGLVVVPQCWFVRGWIERHHGEIALTTA
ncbi:MAG: N-acetyltransferase [Actinobacteria bacterium]|uniref:Unannotated protein n=1 Tax=freshwater metagenome TaxID=449393 RepID=A0A6J7IAE8_9ZZZZ|nr:N-acetyltransferase [Actinomycetota bacterium]